MIKFFKILGSMLRVYIIFEYIGLGIPVDLCHVAVFTAKCFCSQVGITCEGCEPLFSQGNMAHKFTGFYFLCFLFDQDIFNTLKT